MAQRVSRTAALYLLVAAVTVGCGAPTADTSACAPAPDEVVEVIGARVDVPGELRTAQQVASAESGTTFISAELHEPEQDEDEDGDIHTWAADASGDGYLAVDVRARDASSWPDAEFDVRRDGAVDSRACTDQARDDEPDTGDGGGCPPGQDQLCRRAQR